MSLKNTADIFNFYRNAAYFSMKWSVTGPVVLAGNLLDLCTMGFSKHLINVSPVMTKIPFFSEVTQKKEKSYEDIPFFNKGFSGLLRMVATLAITLPLELVAPVAAVLLTALHQIISPFVNGFTEVVVNNMCGNK